MIQSVDNWSGVLPSELKVRNRSAVLNVFRSGEEYTANDISELIGLSRQTVMKAIKFFVDNELIISNGMGSSTEIGGKKPELFSLHCGVPALSITMWPESLNITLINMQGQRLGRVDIDWKIPSSPEAAIAMVRTHALNLIADYGYTISDLFGVTLSIPGTIDYATGTLRYSSQMPEWGTDVPLREYFKEIFNAHLFIENAGKMTGRSALLDEVHRDKRILVLFCTWGLSACFIDNGRILGGQNSLVGEVGHMVLNPNDPEQCGCGGYGCFERLVDIERVRRRILLSPTWLAASSLSEVTIDTLTFSDLFFASASGDVFARALVSDIAEIFALALRNIALAFEPELVIFQGDYSDADEYFCGQVMANLKKFQYFPSGGAFQMKFDQRDLLELDVMGSLNYLQDAFFKNSELYTD